MAVINIFLTYSRQAQPDKDGNHGQALEANYAQSGAG